MNASRPSLKGNYCVAIPAFDSAATISALVRQAKQLGFRVIVVDDGSHDRTSALASDAGALVISHLRNLGKGCALRTAFAYALRERFDGVVTMDSDGQHDPEEIAHLIQVGEHQHAGLVLGNRMAAEKSMPRVRLLTNQLMSQLISALIGQPIPDTQCGFRFIRREVLMDIALRSRRFEIETEVLFGAAARHWKIISIPVRSINQNHPSHIQPLRESLRFFATVLRYLWTYRVSAVLPRRTRSA